MIILLLLLLLLSCGYSVYECDVVDVCLFVVVVCCQWPTRLYHVSRRRHSTRQMRVPRLPTRIGSLCWKSQHWPDWFYFLLPLLHLLHCCLSCCFASPGVAAYWAPPPPIGAHWRRPSPCARNPFCASDLTSATPTCQFRSLSYLFAFSCRIYSSSLSYNSFNLMHGHPLFHSTIPIRLYVPLKSYFNHCHFSLHDYLLLIPNTYDIKWSWFIHRTSLSKLSFSRKKLIFLEGVEKVNSYY